MIRTWLQSFLRGKKGIHDRPVRVGRGQVSEHLSGRGLGREPLVTCPVGDVGDASRNFVDIFLIGHEAGVVYSRPIESDRRVCQCVRGLGARARGVTCSFIIVRTLGAPGQKRADCRRLEHILYLSHSRATETAALASPNWENGRATRKSNEYL